MNPNYACLTILLLAGCFSEPAPNQNVSNLTAADSDIRATEANVVAATEQAHQRDVDASANAQQAEEIAVGTTFNATYVSTPSGNPVVLDSANHGHLTVFLFGVAAPEDGQTGFSYARDSLKRLLQGHEITVRVRKMRENGGAAVDLKVPAAAIYGPDQNGVNLPPIRINGRIVQSGAGRYDESEAPGDGQLIHAQEIAQSKRLGIWGDKQPANP